MSKWLSAQRSTPAESSSTWTNSNGPSQRSDSKLRMTQTSSGSSSTSRIRTAFVPHRDAIAPQSKPGGSTNSNQYWPRMSINLTRSRKVTGLVT